MTAPIRHSWRIALVALLSATLALTTVASASGDDDDERGSSLVGTWALTVPVVPGFSFRINRTFFANGTNVDASTFTPISPQAAGALIVSDGHGAWKRIGRGKFAVTLIFLQLNPNTGLLDTYGKVRETVRVRNGVYDGVFKTQIFLPDGTLINDQVSGTTHGVLIPAQPAP